MRFFSNQHSYYCGIDLHARNIYICIIDSKGNVLVHKNLLACPDRLLEVIRPYMDDLVIGVECVFMWYWVADFCNEHGIEFVLGHALYMKAIHGGKAKNDRIDSKKLAVLLRGGSFPLAYTYPREMRATRDLLRRRHHLMRQRAQLIAHVQNTTSQYNLPPLEKKISRKCNRPGVPERFEDPAVRKSIETDLALMEHYDTLLNGLQTHILRNARHHDPVAFHLLRSVPGIGPILALTILYEIHTVDRFPRVQEFVSYSRMVKCHHSSAGKLYGAGGSKIGNAHLKWAFSEAIVLFLRGNLRAQKMRTRLQKKHGKGKALSIMAHKLARAVYYMLKRRKPFEMNRFFQN